ncbi:MAG: hypothetical protein RJA07_2653 [Bacteroidota bacterium]|jgi:hypothetical protein
MMNYTIKTYTKSTEVHKPHFYILREGLNAGKPLTEACANCFIVMMENDFDKETMYWFCYALWQTKIFEQRLTGNVIPFLRIGKLLWTLSEYIPKMDSNKRIVNSIAKLRVFQSRSVKLQEYLTMIEQSKRSALRHLLTEIPGHI